jgi:hypothetical protein
MPTLVKIGLEAPPIPSTIRPFLDGTHMFNHPTIGQTRHPVDKLWQLEKVGSNLSPRRLCFTLLGVSHVISLKSPTDITMHNPTQVNMIYMADVLPCCWAA